ncbi:MAG: biotin synthase BioB [Acidobacteria bacterium]|nr:biotin synthase BioB [Acidobacteriota bacterium]
MTDWNALAEAALAGKILSRDEALGVLRAPDSNLLELLQAALRVRRYYHGLRVRIHVLMNAKSGFCPEDCHFCSQSSISTAQINRHRLLSKAEIVEGARRAHEARAWKYCIVTATRGPSWPDLETICEAVRKIKQQIPIKVCCSLGLLTPEKAKKLKEAGVDRYNHNLETSARLFPTICTTHTYQDRVNTLGCVKEMGIETCSGGIIGMGEEDEDIVQLACAVRQLDVDSIPLNFLNPIEGTPLGHRRELTPTRCLKVLALFRFLNPAKDIRAAGGREVNLRQLQPLVLYAANSLFAGGYLTTNGQAVHEVHQMIEDLGFEVEERAP